MPVSTPRPSHVPAIDIGRGGLTLPPYGYVNALFQWDVDSRRVPVGFCIDGAPATPAQWQRCVQGLVDDLAQWLWPRFDAGTGQWRGDAATHALDLTRADLQLMPALAAHLLALPAVEGRAIESTHKAMFIEEDVRYPGQAPLPTLDAYLPMLEADQLTKLKDNVRRSLVDLGPAQLRFKEAFQRPRPQQMAFMLGAPLSHEWAKSSLTPAMISGHCFQAMVTRTAGYLALKPDLEAGPRAVAALQQYTADVGDRRVFAGVHYPSDNISSWYCALRLCDHMYGEVGQVAKDFMRGAMGRSLVFQALQVQVQADPRSPFAGPMARLAAEAERPARRTDV